MPTRDGYPEGVPSWVDLGTTDVGAAKAFYTELFGWEYSEAETDSAPYTMATKRGLSAAGIGPNPDPSMPSVWSTYFAVDNADATVERIKAAGGTMIMDCFDVMDAGRMAFVSDPTGAAFGIWQAGVHKGAGVVNEHGSLNWNELMSDDLEKALAFYVEVFGWTHETTEMPNGPYTVFSVGDRAVGGAMRKPEEVSGVPNYWGVYFAVDDVAAAIETATANGGTIDYGPMEIPEVGIFAGLADSTGGHFTVIQLAGEVD
ncbi:MAG: VOC family protein [Actinomycetota bacterium]|nr:VOC family protein [Actinomycetota bacterium]